MWRNYEKGAQVDNVSPELQQLIQSLFNSILEVKDKYLYYTTGDDKERVSYVERAFAYELYFQWKKDDTVFGDPMWNHDGKYCINAEITKQFVEQICDKKNWGYPDMVLHGGNNSSSNYIVCEIKRQENIGKMTEDINKLGFLMRNDLHVKNGKIEWAGYKYGVFILTGQYHNGGNVEVKTSDILNNLKINELNVLDELKSRIICVVYNGKNLKYNNLLEVLEEKDK